MFHLKINNGGFVLMVSYLAANILKNLFCKAMNTFFLFFTHDLFITL